MAPPTANPLSLLRMRTVRVDEPESDHTWVWITAGVALGVVGGMLLSGRLKGGRGKLASLVETARSLKDAWDGPEEDEELDADERDEAADAELDDESEEDEAEVDAIDARVLEAFINDPILMERSVEIEERDPGVIILHGQMRSAREAKHAVTIARGVPGVERVRTRLTVRERPR